MARRTVTLAHGIAQRLAHARELRGITVRELAEQSMMESSTVVRLARGAVVNPGVGTLYDLAKALGVAPEWLAYGAGEGPL